MVFGIVNILLVTWYGIKLSTKKIELETKAEANKEAWRRYFEEREAQFREEMRLMRERQQEELRLMHIRQGSKVYQDEEKVEEEKKDTSNRLH